MEELFGCLVVVIVILLGVVFIPPIAAILLAVSLTMGFVCGFFLVIAGYVGALVNNINPYNTYEDKSISAQPGTKRNYFFGPGYHQIAVIFKNSFSRQMKYADGVGKWSQMHLVAKAWYWDMWPFIFFMSLVLITLVLGFAWNVVFSAALAVVVFTGTAVFYIYFISLWSADRLLLMFRSISSRCPHCKRTAIVPMFECKQCGMKHKKLTPGPYGVLKRKCACGLALPTTIFNGRSQLRARCAYCDVEMAASDAHQFGIQLVGGANVGKTTFLASFWHQYLEASRAVDGLETTCSNEGAFKDLEDLYHRGLSVATADTNANMYSVIHRLSEMKSPLQFAFYDIAGEAFSRLNENIQQQQFQYCEGVIFVIDPKASIESTQDALQGFLDTFKALKGVASTERSALPVAIIISKADRYKQEIGLVKIKAEHNKNAVAYADKEGNASLERTRDGVCRAFLDGRGFTNVVNLLDCAFMTTAVFPVSAIGHDAAEGKSYEPWGVMQPVFWILRQSNERGKAFFKPIASVVEKNATNKKWSSILHY